MTDRLVLGTVQLGMPYGIGNRSGKPDFNSACEIVKSAFDLGVTRFDTAQAYGDSEEVLGRIFDKFKLGSRHIKVYSKLDQKIDLRDKEVIWLSVEESLKRLHLDQLEGLLLHHEDGIKFWDEGLKDTLRELVTQGKVNSTGVSFYTPQKADIALDIDGIDFIQVPANILDQRFNEKGVFKKAEVLKKKVFVRSVFLQGLLLMPLDQVPASMKYALPYLEQVQQLASKMKLSRQELVLGYAAQAWPNSFLLFGAESKVQVLDNLRAFSSKMTLKIDDNIFKNVPENILNPVLWPKT